MVRVAGAALRPNCVAVRGPTANARDARLTALAGNLGIGKGRGSTAAKVQHGTRSSSWTQEWRGPAEESPSPSGGSDVKLRPWLAVCRAHAYRCETRE